MWILERLGHQSKAPQNKVFLDSHQKTEEHFVSSLVTVGFGVEHSEFWLGKFLFIKPCHKSTELKAKWISLDPASNRSAFLDHSILVTFHENKALLREIKGLPEVKWWSSLSLRGTGWNGREQKMRASPRVSLSLKSVTLRRSLIFTWKSERRNAWGPVLKRLSWRALSLVCYSVTRDVFLIFHPHSNVSFLQRKWGRRFIKHWLSLPYPNSFTALSDLSPFTEFLQSLFLDFPSYTHSLGPQILGCESPRFWHLVRRRTSDPEHSFTLDLCVRFPSLVSVLTSVYLSFRVGSGFRETFFSVYSHINPTMRGMCE